MKNIPTEVLQKSGETHKMFFKILPYLLILFVIFSLYFKITSYDISGTDDDVFSQITFKNTSVADTFSIFLRSSFDYYRPLLTLSFMTDNSISNNSPQALHTTNIILHSIACMLFFFFLKNYFFNTLLSLLAALFFAVHPVNIFAVAWIPGRNDLLLFIFMISSVIFLVQYAKTQKNIFFILHYLAFAASLLTKEVAILMPVIYIFYMLNRKTCFKKYTVPVILWTAGSFILFLIHFVASSKMFTMANYMANLSASYKTFFDYYCGAYFLQIHFSSYFGNALLWLGILAFFMSFIFAFFSKLTAIEKIFYFAFPPALILICLLSGQFFYQGNRMYIPTACLIITFCSFADRLKNKKIIYVFLICLISISFFITHKQSSYFENPIAFLHKTDSERPNYNTYMANLYSYNLMKYNRLAEASVKVKEIAKNTNYKSNYNLYMLAVIYMHEKNYAQAAEIFSRIIAVDPFDIYIKLYICYDFTGEIEKRIYCRRQLDSMAGDPGKVQVLISNQLELFKR